MFSVSSVFCWAIALPEVLLLRDGAAAATGTVLQGGGAGKSEFECHGFVDTT